jgi:integrase
MIKRIKPQKPYKDFPLTPHPSGRWCKKIRGKLVYFGPWEDWEAALEKYQSQRDDLQAGRKPQSTGDTIKDLLHAFLYGKKLLVETGELAECSYRDYEQTCDKIEASLGNRRPVSSLTLSDFEQLRADLAKGKRSKLGLVALKGELTRSRMVFLYAAELGFALQYRKALKSPTLKNLRRVRNEQGERMFEAKAIQAILKAATPTIRAMTYLGINCGFGPTDCARLTFDKIDLKAGWHRFARPKTHNPRRCPLWPETVKAIAAAIRLRPTPALPEFNNLIFLTRWGNCWARKSGDNALSSEFADLLKEVKLYREGNTFYSLRRTLETIGATAGEQVALDFIMGHVDANDDMAARYRQKIFDKPLLTVSNHVRGWLFGKIKLS